MYTVRSPTNTDHPHPFVGREEDVERLADYFRGGGRVALVTGGTGSGKTTLAEALAAYAASLFPGGIRFHLAGDSRAPSFPPDQARSYLFVIDNAHNMSERTLGYVWDAFEQDQFVRLLLLGEYPPLKRPPFGIELELKPLRPAAVRELVQFFGVQVDSTALHARVRGNARATIKALEALLAGATWEEYLQSLSNAGFTTNDGLAADDGLEDLDKIAAPLSLAPAVIADIVFINEILEQLARHPVEFYKLHPRKFEEVVAEILSKKGYTVTLTPESKDRGFDMYAARKEALGEFVYLVKCKRYAPENKVGVHIVRGLQGVVAENRATAAALVTTSSFTRGSIEYQSKFQHTLKLHDYLALQLWLRQIFGLAA